MSRSTMNPGVNDLPNLPEEDQITLIRQWGEERNEKAVPVLVEMIPKTSGGIRESIIDSLIEIGSLRGAELLVKLIRHDDFTARNEAIRAIEGIGETAIPALIPHLKDQDEDIRKFIIDILGNIKSPDTVDVLESLVEDPNTNVRAAVGESLGKIGDPRAVPTLIKLLDDEDWVKISAIEALGNFDAPEALPALLPLAEHDNPMIAMATLKALALMGDEETFCHLTALLGEKSEILDSYILMAIGKIFSRLGLEMTDEIRSRLSDHVSIILENLENEEPEISDMAAFMLSEIRSPQSIRSVVRFAMNSETIPDILMDILSEPDELYGRAILEEFSQGGCKTRKFFIEALGKSGLKEAIPILFNCIEKGDDEARIKAVKALAYIKDKSVCRELIPLLEDPLGHIRRAAAETLGSLKCKDSIPKLLSTMSDKFEDVRRAAADALLSIGGKRIYDRIGALLQSDNDNTRMAAAYALSKIDDPDDYGEQLIEAINDTNWQVRKNAAAALGKVKDKKAVENLTYVLTDENNEVKMKAINVLCRRGDPEILDTLIPLLKDVDVWIRYETARGLGSIKSPLSVEALIESLEDESPVVQAAALESLGAIGGEEAIEAIEKMTDSPDFEVQDTALSILDNLAVEDDYEDEML